MLTISLAIEHAIIVHLVSHPVGYCQQLWQSAT